MNLLIIGNIASGKTTLSKTICQIADNFSLENCFSIDNLRKEYSDGTYSGEFLAWSKMLEYMQYPTKENTIFEFSGTGKNTWFVKQTIEQTFDKYKTQWRVIYCSCDREVLLDRNKNRTYDVPMPYKFGEPADTISFMSKELNNKYKYNFWDVEAIAVQTDKLPPVVCAKEVLNNIGEPYGIY